MTLCPARPPRARYRLSTTEHVQLIKGDGESAPSEGRARPAARPIGPRMKELFLQRRLYCHKTALAGSKGTQIFQQVMTEPAVTFYEVIERVFNRAKRKASRTMAQDGDRIGDACLQGHLALESVKAVHGLQACHSPAGNAQDLAM
ncbi:hypothetical protein NDU88_002435 [Pleurodeles waltl]|uniref:Uncharacterized protein n=1 Tax=Pleurodeles waltl TaxID=8319 RepID=A0AAV7UVM6_PLEWA|nr:hypothetical protein NDU88_002435 [Pleurodeles waltl]